MFGRRMKRAQFACAWNPVEQLSFENCWGRIPASKTAINFPEGKLASRRCFPLGRKQGRFSGLPMCSHPIPPLGEKVGIQCRDGRTLPERFRPKIILIKAAHISPRLFEDETAGGIVPQFLCYFKFKIAFTIAFQVYFFFSSLR